MDDQLHQALSGDSIEPSSGFTSRVMEAVRRSAAEPPPLRFPWGRLALGVTACAALAGAGTRLAGEAVWRWTAAADAMSPLAAAGPELGYAGLAVAIALAFSRFPRLFIRS